MVSGTNHQGIKLIVHRPDVLPELKEKYYMLSSELMPVISELVRKTMPLLIHEDSTSVSKNHLYGSQFNADSIAKKDFRYFAKKLPPDESTSLVVALRIDESASMSAFGRLEAAKRAAIAVYEFCEQCNIPIIIYGDTADRSSLEQMSIYAYCDFEHSEYDDRFRLMNIQGRSNNRDGMAIRILAEKLLMASKQTKLMISISDGQPKAMPDYSGDVAISDMQMVLKEYRRKGITFLAAAIGQDKDTICDIYGKESFLDITDLKQLPVRLARIIARYLSK
jgi:nitric oxide reductase activation protein